MTMQSIPYSLTNRISIYRIIQTIFLSLLFVFSSKNSFATALFNNIVDPYVATQLIYDSNILRLPDNASPDRSGGKTARDSLLKQIQAGLATKWQFSQQEVLADVRVDQNWYSNYSELDYIGYRLFGQWNWRIDQRLKGQMSYRNQRKLSGFQQVNRLLNNNLENRDIFLINGSYEIIPDWFLRGEFSHANTRYSAESRKQSNIIENTVQFGTRYFNESKNMLGAFVMITDAKYPNRNVDTTINNVLSLDNAYTRTNYMLEGQWNYSVKTRLRGQVGFLSQRFKHFEILNFSDIVARGDILWQTTTKTSFLLEGWRDVYAADSLTATFQLSQGLRLTPVWLWSEDPKVQIELPISYEQQISLGTIDDPTDNVTVTASPQQAEKTIFRLNLNYVPKPNIEMQAFASYENRDSTRSNRSYNDQMIGLNMKFSF